MYKATLHVSYNKPIATVYTSCVFIQDGDRKTTITHKRS